MMKRTKIDNAYEKIGGEFIGCLLIVPLMIVGVLLLFKLMSLWDLPTWLVLLLGTTVLIGPQILIAQMNERAKHLSKD